MDSSKILNADILDILFEGKNKEYGAYDLRKTYNRRFTKALITTGGVIVLVCTAYIVSSQNNGNKKVAMLISDSVTLVQAVREDPPPPPPPPPVLPPPPAVAMTQFTPPRVVPDKDVKPDEKPPENDKLDDTRIGTVNTQGAKDDGLTPPAPDAGTGVVEAPKRPEEDYDKTFIKVEQESFYPGGMEAWKRYLNKNFRYPDEAQNNEIQGVVTVQFIVDKDGNVSDVQAVSGPEQGGLREEAVRVIKKSGKWTPAVQNGRQVKSYKKQPITFRLEGQ
ncbi:MAG TPA: TonB family protein [Puia sp.]|nr:TonB family protein [Puia sp.]